MHLQHKKKYVADLEVLEVSGKDPSGPYVVMLHGWGASANDLISLCQEVKVPPNTTWLFPNGPIKIPFSADYVGRAWFSIDMEKIEASMRQGKYENFTKILPDGLHEASLQILELLKSLPVPMNRVIVGGFSQGAMLACEVAFQLKEHLAGLAVLSGTLLSEERWTKFAQEKANLAYFISHGNQDAILDPSHAAQLGKIFSESGMKGEIHHFEGGHTIPYEITEALGTFICKALK